MLKTTALSSESIDIDITSFSPKGADSSSSSIYVLLKFLSIFKDTLS